MIGAQDARSAEPVAIGGIGGSGTRLIAALLIELGYFLGADLNGSLDNLAYTLLFKRPAVLELDHAGFEQLLAIFIAGLMGEPITDSATVALLRSIADEARQPEFPREWFHERADALIRGHGMPVREHWGWKEPNSHLVMDRFLAAIPELKYLHLMRNGLDMAYSANQTQLRFWGPLLLGRPIQLNPADALKYWRAAHERILGLQRRMPSRVLILDYDRFCALPEQELSRLLEFLGRSVALEDWQQLITKVDPPSSIGRFKRYGLDRLDPDDVAFVAGLGYDV